MQAPFPSAQSAPKPDGSIEEAELPNCGANYLCTGGSQDCTFNMRASGPVHPGCCRSTTLPPTTSVTVLQSLQSVPDEGQSFITPARAWYWASATVVV